jgi:hypothetical protein
MKREETQSRETGSTLASALPLSNPHEQITHLSVSIQASAELTPAVPAWFGEVVLVVTYLKKQGVLMKLCEPTKCATRC